MQRRKESRQNPNEGKPLSAHEAGKLAPRVRETAAATAEYGASRLTSVTSVLDGMTQGEMEVLGLIATPMSNAEAAKQRTAGVPAIEKHLEGIYRKLGVKTRADAVAIFWRERDAASQREKLQLRAECARLRAENEELRSENERLQKGGDPADE